MAQQVELEVLSFLEKIKKEFQKEALAITGKADAIVKELFESIGLIATVNGGIVGAQVSFPCTGDMVFSIGMAISFGLAFLTATYMVWDKASKLKALDKIYEERRADVDGQIRAFRAFPAPPVGDEENQNGVLVSLIDYRVRDLRRPLPTNLVSWTSYWWMIFGLFLLGMAEIAIPVIVAYLFCKKGTGGRSAAASGLGRGGSSHGYLHQPT